MIKLLIIVGARPNFIKIAPLMEEIKKYRKIKPVLVHTGQHYDDKMSDLFFEDLGLPRPNVYLGVGSGTQAVQTAKIMIKFEKVLVKEKPDLIIVVGDVNSTLACSIVAAKLCIPVAHVEAGLRSFDRTMPEEINRIVTDSLSDFLFTTCEDANQNLRKEGVPENKIYFVGNVMIDTLLKHRERAKKSNILKKLGIEKGTLIDKYELKTNYAVLTLHRPSNVDNKDTFQNILEALKIVSREIPIIFPIHPRTKKQIKKFGFYNYLFFPSLNSTNPMNLKNSINCIDPVGYFDFLHLMANSKLALTDSGGIQEETTILDIPCLTIRANTERPVTITQGTNVLVGTDKEKIVTESLNILNGGGKIGRIPKLWDGKAAERIVEILSTHL